MVATTTVHLPDEHLVFSGLAPDYDPLFTLGAGDLVVCKVPAACSVASIRASVASIRATVASIRHAIKNGM